MFDHHLKCHQQSPTIGLLAAIWTLCSQLGQPFDADSIAVMLKHYLNCHRDIQKHVYVSSFRLHEIQQKNTFPWKFARLPPCLLNPPMALISGFFKHQLSLCEDDKRCCMTGKRCGIRSM